jgi:4-amino-4-deoxy-L-arabinose transferase-like glycosyltransferase
MRVLLFFLIVLAALRVVATYRVFSETNDEHHFVAGIEWLDRGAYTYTIYHPPLARIFESLPLYLDGARAHGKAEVVDEKDAILYAGRGYATNLALGRLGALPFLIASIAAVWIWGRRLFGVPAAVAATVLFSTLPPVLAHAGLATTDAPVMATLAVALYALCLFLEKPTAMRALGLGAACALAVLSKFSAIPFFAAAALAILAARWIVGRRGLDEPGRAPSHGIGWAVPAVLAVLVAALVVWAGYRFSWGSLPETVGPRSRDIVVGAGARATAGTPVPAPEFFEGIRRLRETMREGHPAFLLGRYGRTGWWYYFPVALAVKTPIPFLILAAIGGIASLRLARRSRDWRPAAPFVAAGAILAASMPSRIDIGVRHILPMYPLLAVSAGLGTTLLWNAARRGRAGRIAVGILFTWQTVGSAAAHPDYLAWFNELAGGHPDRILLDSNLDWGQDLYRLRDALAARHVASVSLAYLGVADPARQGLPPTRPLPPDHPTTGWVAISEMWRKDVPGGGHAYAWLRSDEPVARVGRSILLYDLPGRE